MSMCQLFCLSLLTLGNRCQKPLINILLALCSSPGVKSVVELSLSPFFQYSYSVITKVLTRWKCPREMLMVFVMRYIGAALSFSNGIKYYSFIHDVTKLPKPHSDCLESRSFHVTNNPIGGRRQLSAGHELSCLVYNSGQSGHCPIVDSIRLNGDENLLAIAREQIESMMNLIEFECELILIKVDSNYGRAAFLHLAYQYANMLILSRLQSGVNVYFPFIGEHKRGRKRIYGDQYTLIHESRDKNWYEPNTRTRGVKRQISIHERPFDEKVTYEAQMGKDKRMVIVEVTRWNGALMRSKRGMSMEENQLDIVCIKISDAQTKEEIFMRPMFLAVAGKKRESLPTSDVGPMYKGRFDIEPQFRFEKYELLMDRLQTPVLEHFDVWLQIITLATWFLYLVAQETKLRVYHKWQKHLKHKENENEILTTSEARKAAASIIHGFDLTPFSPTPFIIGTGRKVGTKVLKRIRFRVRKKREIRAEKLANTG